MVVIGYISLLWPLCQGTLAMTAAAARRTSLENKHLHRCDYFLIIRHCLQSMLERYATTRLVCRPLNLI